MSNRLAWSWTKLKILKMALMTKCFALIMLAGLSVSCGAVPERPPLTATHSVLPADVECADPYIEGQWQFAHTIEAILADGKKSVFMGVTVVSSRARSIKCAIMTIEGFVLFEAQSNPGIRVLRAVPPFDSRSFAQGLIRDIQLMFLRPKGAIINSGFDENGSVVCRYRDSLEGSVDVIRHKDNSWELRQYNRDLRLVRRVLSSSETRSCACERQVFPETIELSARGASGYRLILRLVEAVKGDL